MSDRVRPEVSDRKIVFVVGCPRSGTTWVQMLLAQHPEVATAPETQIFAYYLDHFQRQWEHERTGPSSNHQGTAGLSRLLRQEEFDELCRVAARFVLDKISAGNPSARVVVEKSPKHALYLRWIHRVLPEAYFIHVVRDPRDTVASLLAASRDWAADWAPKNAIEAARMWRAHVSQAREGRCLTSVYHELSYESLEQDPTSALSALFDWLGIPIDAASCHAAVEACSFRKLKNGADSSALPLPGTRSPAGFFRKGKAGGWQDELSRGQVRLIEHICGDLMDLLGYRRSIRSPGGARFRVLVHDALQRVRESVDWQLERLLYRV